MIVKKCIHHGELVAAQVRAITYKGKKSLKCIECEKIRAKKYHAKSGDIKKEKDKKYWKENKDKVKARRALPEKKEASKMWRDQNKEKYRQYYNEKQAEYRRNLDDVYVRRNIINGNKYLSAQDIPQDMVELSKTLLLIKRTVNELALKRKIEGMSANGKD